MWNTIRIEIQMKISAHFDEEEFMCPCGCGEYSMSALFIEKLENARYLANIPFSINSGKRCEAHNLAIGGKKQSDHLVGKAADISCTTAHGKFIILGALFQAGFKRIGVYKNFIHAGHNLDNAQEVVW